MWSTISVIAFLSFVTFYSSIITTTLFVLSYLFWIYQYATIFIYKSKSKRVTEKLFEWYNLLINCVFFVSYLFYLVNNPILSILSLILIISFLLVMINVVFLILMKQARKNSLLLVLFYFSSVFGIIFLFTFFYTTFGQTPIGQIVNQLNSTRALTVPDYLYFSSSTFYTSSFGDLIPGDSAWLARLFTQIEVALSFVLHVIYLGKILSDSNTDK
jgi:hypothetical protein